MHTLSLIAAVRMKLPDGKEEVKDIPVFDEQIQVRVNPIFTVRTFIGSYWQWLATGIILPVIAFLVKRYLDREKPAPANAQVNASTLVQPRKQHRNSDAKQQRKH